jgi:hypothetical protein
MVQVNLLFNKHSRGRHAPSSERAEFTRQQRKAHTTHAAASAKVLRNALTSGIPPRPACPNTARSTCAQGMDGRRAHCHPRTHAAAAAPMSGSARADTLGCPRAARGLEPCGRLGSRHQHAHTPTPAVRWPDGNTPTHARPDEVAYGAPKGSRLGGLAPPGALQHSRAARCAPSSAVQSGRSDLPRRSSLQLPRPGKGPTGAQALAPRVGGGGAPAGAGPGSAPRRPHRDGPPRSTAMHVRAENPQPLAPHFLNGLGRPPVQRSVRCNSQGTPDRPPMRITTPVSF